MHRDLALITAYIANIKSYASRRALVCTNIVAAAATCKLRPRNKHQHYHSSLACYFETRREPKIGYSLLTNYYLLVSLSSWRPFSTFHQNILFHLGQDLFPSVYLPTACLPPYQLVSFGQIVEHIEVVGRLTCNICTCKYESSTHIYNYYCVYNWHF